MTARGRLAYTALAAMSLSAPTAAAYERLAADITRDDIAAEHERDARPFMRGEYVTVSVTPAPPASDYPRNRAERRSATNRARRGAPGRRR